MTKHGHLSKHTQTKICIAFTAILLTGIVGLGGSEGSTNVSLLIGTRACWLSPEQIIEKGNKYLSAKEKLSTNFLSTFHKSVTIDIERNGVNIVYSTNLFGTMSILDGSISPNGLIIKKHSVGKGRDMPQSQGDMQRLTNSVRSHPK